MTMMDPNLDEDLMTPAVDANIEVDEELQHSVQQNVQAMKRVLRWKVLPSMKQIGATALRTPAGAALMDHRRATMMHRLELQALSKLLIAKGVISKIEYVDALTAAAHELDRTMEQAFPGFRVTETGIAAYAPDVAVETTKGWLP